MTSLDCPFCRKLSNLDEVPADDMVWHFPHSVALLGASQYYLGYCLLVARRHATELSQLSEPERRAYLDEMCLLAKAIQDCLFPRYENDPDRLRPVWHALDRAERDETERHRLQAGPQDRRQTIAVLQGKLRELVGG
jgi:diadenosine tetraphosphate (Ap4A) HIT family hydrolase